MEIVYENLRNPIDIRMGDIPTGTTFTGSVGIISGLFIKVHKAVINLSETTIWSEYADKSASQVIVHNYFPVNIKIIVSQL